jgi:hypothetical protein
MKSGFVFCKGMYIGIEEKARDLMTLIKEPFMRVCEARSAANVNQDFQIITSDVPLMFRI